MAPPSEDIIKKLAKGEIKRPKVDEIIRDYAKDEDVDRLSALIENGSLKDNQITAIINGTYSLTKKIKEDGGVSISLHFDIVSGPKSRLDGPLHINLLNRLLDKQVDAEKKKRILSGLIPDNDIDFVVKLLNEGKINLSELEAVLRKDYAICSFGDSPVDAELKILIPLELIFENGKFDSKQLQMILDGRYTPNQLVSIFNNQFNADEIRALFNIKIDMDTLKGLLKGNFEIKRTPMSDGSGYVIELTYKRESYKQYLQDILDGKYPFEEVLQLFGGRIGVEELEAILSMNLTVAQLHALICGDYIVERKENPDGSYSMHMTYKKGAGDVTEIPEIHRDDDEITEEVKEIIISSRTSRLPFQQKDFYKMSKGQFDQKILNERIKTVTNETDAKVISDMLLNKKLSENDVKTILKIIFSVNISEDRVESMQNEEVPKEIKKMAEKIQTKTTSKTELKEWLKPYLNEAELETMVQILLKFPLSEEEIEILLKNVKSKGPSNIKLTQNVIDNIINNKYEKKEITQILENFIDKENVDNFVKIMKRNDITKEQKNTLIRTVVSNAHNIAMKEVEIKRLLDKKIEENELKDLLSDRIQPEDFDMIKSLLNSGKLNETEVRTIFKGPVKDTHVVLSDDNIEDIVKGQFSDNDLTDIIGNYVTDYYLAPVVDLLTKKNLTEPEKRSIVKTVVNANVGAPLSYESMERIISDKDTKIIEDALSDRVTKEELKAMKELIQKDKIDDDLVPAIFGGKNLVPDYCMSEEAMQKIINKDCAPNVVKDLLKPYVSEKYVTSVTKLLKDKNIDEPKKRAYLSTMMVNLKNPVKPEVMDEIIGEQIDEYALKDALKSHCLPEDTENVVELIKKKALNADQMCAMLGGKNGPVVPNEKRIEIVQGKVPKEKLEKLFEPLVVEKPTKIIDIVNNKNIPEEKRMVIVDTMLEKPEVSPKDAETISQIATGKVKPLDLKEVLKPNVDEAEIEKFINLIDEKTLSQPQLTDLLGPMKPVPVEINDSDRDKIINLSSDYNTIKSIVEPLVRKENLEPVINLLTDSSITPNQRKAILNTLLHKPTIKPMTSKEVENIVSKKIPEQELKNMLKPNLLPEDLPIITNLIRSEILTPEQIDGLIGGLKEIPFQISPADKQKIITGKCDKDEAKKLIKHFVPSYHVNDITELVCDQKISPEQKELVIDILNRKPTVEPKKEDVISKVTKHKYSPEEVQSVLSPNVQEKEVPVLVKMIDGKVLNDKHLLAILGPMEAKPYEIDTEDRKEIIQGICHPEKMKAIFDSLVPKQSMEIIIDTFENPKIPECQKSAVLNTILSKPVVQPKTAEEVDAAIVKATPTEINKLIEDNVQKSDIPIITKMVEDKILQSPQLKAILGPVSESPVEIPENEKKRLITGTCPMEKVKSILSPLVPPDLLKETTDIFMDKKLDEPKKRAILETLLNKPGVFPQNSEDIKKIIFEKMPKERVQEKVQDNVPEKDIKPIAEMITNNDMTGNQIEALLGPAQYVPLTLMPSEKEDLINGRCPPHVIRALLAPVMPKKFTFVTAELFQNPDIKPEEKRAILNTILSKPAVPKLEDNEITKVCDLKQPKNEKTAAIQQNASKPDSEIICNLILNETLNPNHIRAIFGETKDSCYDIDSNERKGIINCSIDKGKLQEILKPLVPARLIQPTIDMLTNKDLTNDQRKAIIDTLLLKVNVIPLDSEEISKIVHKEYSIPELEKVMLPNVQSDDLPVLCNLIMKNKINPYQIEAIFGATEELPVYMKEKEKEEIIKGKIEPEKAEKIFSKMVSSKLIDSVEDIFKNNKLKNEQKRAVLDTLLNKPQCIPLDEDSLLDITSKKQGADVKAIIKPNVNEKDIDTLNDLIITDSLNDNQIKAIFGAKEEEPCLLSKADINEIISGHCDINKLRELLSLVLPSKYVESFVQFFINKERKGDERKAVLETLLNKPNVKPLGQANLEDIPKCGKDSDKIKKIIQPLVKSANLETMTTLIINNKLNENQIKAIFGRPEVGFLTNKQIDNIVNKVYTKEKVKELLSPLIDSSYLDHFIDIIFRDDKLSKEEKYVTLNVANEKFVHPTMSDSELKKLSSAQKLTANELKTILKINKMDTDDFIELILNNKLDKDMILAIFSSVKNKYEIPGAKIVPEVKKEEEEEGITDQNIADIADGNLNRDEIELMLSDHINPQDISVIMNILDNKSLKNADKRKLLRSLTRGRMDQLRTAEEDADTINNSITSVENAKKFLKPYIDNVEIPDFTEFILTSNAKKEDIKVLFKTMTKLPRLITESDIDSICSGKLSDQEITELLSPFMKKEELQFFIDMLRRKTMKENDLKVIIRTIVRKFSPISLMNNVIKNVIHKRYTKSQLTQILRPFVTDGELNKTVNLLLEGPFNTDELTTMIQMIIHRLPIPVSDSDMTQIENKKLSHRQIGEILSRYLTSDEVAKVTNIIMEVASEDKTKVRPIIEGISKKSSIIPVSEDYLHALINGKYDEAHQIDIINHYVKSENSEQVHKIIFKSNLSNDDKLKLLKSIMFPPKPVLLSQDDIVNISTGKMTVHQLNDCLGRVIGQNYTKQLVDILRRISIKPEEKQTLLLGILHKSRKPALSADQIIEIVQKERYKDLDVALEGFLLNEDKNAFIHILSSAADIGYKQALIKTVLCQTYEPSPPLTENTIGSVLDRRGEGKLRQALGHYASEQEIQQVAKICTNGTLKQTQAKHFIQAVMHKSYFNPFTMDDVTQMQKGKFDVDCLKGRLKASIAANLLDDVCKILLNGKLSADEIKTLMECYISSKIMTKSKKELVEVVTKPNLKKEDFKDFMIYGLNEEDHDSISDLITSNSLNAEQRAIICNSTCHVASQDFYPNSKLVENIYSNMKNKESLHKLLSKYIFPLQLEDIIDFFANTSNDVEIIKRIISILIKKTYVLVKLFAETTWIGERAGIDMWPLKMPETYVEKERREVGRLKIPTFVSDSSTYKTSRFEMGREIGKLKMQTFHKAAKDESTYRKTTKGLSKLQPGRITIPDYTKSTSISAADRKSGNKIKIPQLGDEEMKGLGRKELIIPATFLKSDRKPDQPRSFRRL